MRYLLCRPIGGLNDILNQVARCFEYSRITSRTLVIDTNYVYSTHFQLNFKDIFIQFGSENAFYTPSEVKFRDSSSTMPVCLPGPNYQYEVEDIAGLGLCVKGTNEVLSFDFSLDYSQDVLIHHAYGGGKFGINALARLDLAKDLKVQLQTRLEKINFDLDFIGVHIRNTDYKSDYETFLNDLSKNALKKLFLATDSLEVLNYATRVFSEDRVISFTRFSQSKDNICLHNSVDRANAYDRAIDAMSDLIFLSLSKEFYACPLSDGQGAQWSGFSILAYHLRQRPDVLSRFLTL